jgi:2-haloacid dehalogenase
VIVIVIVAHGKVSRFPGPYRASLGPDAQQGKHMDSKFSGIRACAFDAYGTLFDVHAPVASVAARIGDNADALSRLWRQKQLEYTWLRSLMRAHADFWQVTGEALDYALAAYGVDDTGLRDDLMDLYLRLDAYPDAVDALQQLKSAGYITAVLSNGSPAMLEAAVGSAGLAGHLDHVISIEEAGIFKPDPQVYELAVRHAGVAANAICFVSANTWDAQAAAHFGFQVARVDRFGLTDERIPGAPKALIKTLSELPAALS